MEENIKKEELAEKQDLKQEEKKEEVTDTTKHKKTVKINKKTLVISAIIIFVIIIVYLIGNFCIVATVDGSPISRLTVIKRLEKVSGKELLDSLITEKLVQNEAKSKKIVVTNEEIDAQIKIISDQITSQGSTIDVALSAQGMTMEDLRAQIILQKQAEKLVEDKISITDEEVAQYIKDNNIEIPKGQEASTNEQVKSSLANEKLNTEIQTLISELKSRAKIKYSVDY